MPSFRRYFARCATRLFMVFGVTLLVVVPSNAAPDTVIDSAMRSVVAIYKAGAEEKKKPEGSGFFITHDGYLLTASHVVAPGLNENKGATFRLKLLSGDEFEARLIGRNTDLDVALLKIIVPRGPLVLMPLPLKENSQDKNLTILGNPSMDRPKLFDHTDVTVNDPNRNGLEVVNPDAEEGYSGGPVIDATGSAVAIALRQSLGSSVSFVRAIDTLHEFLESNGIVQDGLGYEKHLSLSTLVTVQRVENLEGQLKVLQDDEKAKERLIDDITLQLWNLKSQVHWELSICEVPRLPTELAAEPKHRFTIEYKKLIDIMFDAKGTFNLRIMPLMIGEEDSQRGLAEARARRLYIPHTVKFEHGQNWIFDQFDDEVDAHVQGYNATRDKGSGEIDKGKITGYSVSLTPNKEYDEMQYFGFSDRSVSVFNVKKCE